MLNECYKYILSVHGSELRKEAHRIVNSYWPRLEDIINHTQNTGKREFILCHIKISKFGYFYFRTDLAKGKFKLKYNPNILHCIAFSRILSYRFYDTARHINNGDVKVSYEVYGQKHVTPHLTSERDISYISVYF